MKKQTPSTSPKALVTKQAADRFGLSGVHIRGGRGGGQWRWAVLVIAVLGSLLTDASVKGADPSDTFYGTGALANVTTGFYDSAFGYYLRSTSQHDRLQQYGSGLYGALQQHHRQRQHGHRCLCAPK